MHIFKACLTEKIGQINNPNDSYSLILHTIKDGLTSCVPSKQVKFNRKKHKISQWITKGILVSINTKDKLYKQIATAKKQNQSADIIQAKIIIFKSYKTILNKVIRTAKRRHYYELFDKSDNTRQTWCNIKKIIGNKKSTNTYPDSFYINNTQTSNKTEISNKFNEFFASIGTNLASTISNNNPHAHLQYLAKACPNNFVFKPISTDYVHKIITSKIKGKNSCGMDEISSNLLRYLKDVLINPLAKLINQCLETGIFPDALKIAKVIPLYKKDDNQSLNNYRPISLLPAISKIFERVIFDQIHEHFTTNKLYYDKQYGFRPQHSTEHAAQELVHKILNDMDKKDTPIGIFLDLSKAFDTLNHNILFDKLSFYGIKGNALKLCQNYLTNREQYVNFDGTNSSTISLSTGVPQVSILGPLFFLIYINDISHSSSIFNPISYADDTTLYTTLEKIENLDSNIPTGELLSTHLNLVNEWLSANKLTLNINKTKYMIFTPNNKHRPQTFNIVIDGKQIEKVEQFDFLGITIDNKLNWKCHINKIVNKLSRNIGIINQLKNFLPTHILRLLYNSMILPHIQYGSHTWAYCAKSELQKIIKLQKRAIRIITKTRYNFHTAPLFKSLNILTVNDIILLNEIKMYAKYKLQELPCYQMQILSKLHVPIQDRHRTRQNNIFNIPRTRSKFAERTVLYQCPVTINNTSRSITDKASTHSFKSFVIYAKTIMINKYIINCTRNECPDCNRQTNTT